MHAFVRFFWTTLFLVLLGLMGLSFCAIYQQYDYYQRVQSQHAKILSRYQQRYPDKKNIFSIPDQSSHAEDQIILSMYYQEQISARKALVLPWPYRDVHTWMEQVFQHSSFNKS